MAKDIVGRLRELAARFPFLVLNSLDEVEVQQLSLELQVMGEKFGRIGTANQEGQALGKEGKIDEAIRVFESLLAENVDTPFTYRRLAILYRKRKSRDDEIRVLLLGIRNLRGEVSASHIRWLNERYDKLTDGSKS